METAVLPAQDHLAQERYRHQSRVIPGLIYSLEGLPRTNRKVKPSSQVFLEAFVSGSARLSSKQSMQALDSRSGIASPMDATLGVLRLPPLPSFSTPLQPLPQYRLHSAASVGFMSDESSPPSHKQQLAVSFTGPVSSGTGATPRQVTRTDGGLLQKMTRVVEVGKTADGPRNMDVAFLKETGWVTEVGKTTNRTRLERSEERMTESVDRKAAEKIVAVAKTVDRTRLERSEESRNDFVDRKAAVKIAEVGKTGDRTRVERSEESTNEAGDRKAAEKMMNKLLLEKSFDRRKFSDRKVIEKKLTAISSMQADKSSTVQQKEPVITILRRPRTKVATAESKVPVITILRRPLTEEAAAENMALFAGRPPDNPKGSHNATSQRKPEQGAVKLRSTDTEGDDGLQFDIFPKEGGSDHAHLGNVSTISHKTLAKRKASREHSGKLGSRSASEIVRMDVKTAREAIRRMRAGETIRLVKPGVPRSEESRVPSPISRPSVGYIVSNLTNQGSRGVPSVTPPKAAATVEVLQFESDENVAGEEGKTMVDGPAGRQIGKSCIESSRDPSRTGESNAELPFLPSSPLKTYERWAGPAYTNSPPPSTLPFPTFPIQRVKSSGTAMTRGDVCLLGLEDANFLSKSSSAPSSPTRVASLFSSSPVMQSPFVDPSSATKDLRRLLNLDVEGPVAQERLESILNFDRHSKEMLTETATEGLKRMLQLC